MANQLLPERLATMMPFLSKSTIDTLTNQETTRMVNRCNYAESLNNGLGRYGSYTVATSVTTSRHFGKNFQTQKHNQTNQDR